MRSGRLNVCKLCIKKRTNDFRINNPELKREAGRFWMAKQPKRKLTSAQHKKKNDAAKKRYPEKYKAHYTFKNTFKRGLIKKMPCEICRSNNVQAHHDDYSKPLEVRWLCVRHHNDYHLLEREFIREFNRLENGTSVIS